MPKKELHYFNGWIQFFPLQGNFIKSKAYIFIVPPPPQFLEVVEQT